LFFGIIGTWFGLLSLKFNEIPRISEHSDSLIIRPKYCSIELAARTQGA
jgi:hypothetical protein